jgi:hypothetical protein
VSRVSAAPKKIAQNQGLAQMRTKTTAFLLIILVLLYTFIPFGSAVHHALTSALTTDPHGLLVQILRKADSPRFSSILKLVRSQLGDFYYETRPEEWKKFVFKHLKIVDDAEIVNGIKEIFEQEYFPNPERLKRMLRRLSRNENIQRSYAQIKSYLETNLPKDNSVDKSRGLGNHGTRYLQESRLVKRQGWNLLGYVPLLIIFSLVYLATVFLNIQLLSRELQTRIPLPLRILIELFGIAVQVGIGLFFSIILDAIYFHDSGSDRYRWFLLFASPSTLVLFVDALLALVNAGVSHVSRGRTSPVEARSGQVDVVTFVPEYPGSVPTLENENENQRSHRGKIPRQELEELQELPA